MRLPSNIFIAVSFVDVLAGLAPLQANVETVLVAGGFSKLRQSCQILHGKGQRSLP